jgi:hypothetical protein
MFIPIFSRNSKIFATFLIERFILTLKMTGTPWDSQKATASSGVDMAASVPGMMGRPAAIAD